jgi:hypothetical protein
MKDGSYPCKMVYLKIFVFIYLFIYFLREEGLFLLSFSVHHGKAEINILTSRKQRGEKYKKGSGKNIS